MFQEPQRKRVLFLAQKSRPVLERMLEAAWPDVSIEHAGVEVAAWFPKLLEPDAAGLAVLSDEVPAAALHALHAVLVSRPELRALVLPGGRGLAGIESLLELDHVALLPEPWTPVGLERLSDRLAPAVHETVRTPAAAPVEAAAEAGRPRTASLKVLAEAALADTV